MANIDCPHGFEWIRNPHGGSGTPRIRYFDTYYEAGQTLYRGQCVKLDASGYLVPITGDGTDTHIVGICQEHVVVPAATVVTGIPVVLCAHSDFRIQADDDFVCANRAALMALIGTGCNLTNPAAGDTLGNSTTEVDGTNQGAGGAVVIIWWDERPDNAFGAHMDLVVRFPSDVVADASEFVDEAL